MLIAAFMTALDFFILNVALPAMQRDLGAGPAHSRMNPMRQPIGQPGATWEYDGPANPLP
jgi:MFS family permease